MTAENAGKLAIGGFWGTLKRLRDQWVLLAFAAGALFWARDFWESFVDLPERLAVQEERVAELDAEIAVLAVRKAAVDHSPAIAFPGTRHGIGDGRSGELVPVALDPTEWIRPECRSVELAAYVVDEAGQWHSVETSLARLPQLEGSQRLAFGVRLPDGIAAGRAQFLIQVTQDCGDHRQVDSSPRLHFRVLAP